MLSDFFDVFFNYKMLKRELKHDIWDSSFRIINNKYEEVGEFQPFTYLFVSICTFFVCLYYSIPYIKENIVIGRKGKEDPLKALFKGMELVTNEKGIDWLNVIIVILLIIIMFQLLFISID